MREEKFKRLVGAALEDFLKTGSGEALVGNIVLRALRQHFSSYELEMETTHPDGTTERFTRKGDPLALICQWIKNTEGAIRGCQSDAAQARNRSAQVRDMMLVAMGERHPETLEILPERPQINNRRPDRQHQIKE